MKNKTEEKESRCDLSVFLLENSLPSKVESTFQGTVKFCNIVIVDIQQEMSVKYT